MIDRIPGSIRIKYRERYDVLWKNDLGCLCMCDFDNKQILLDFNQSDINAYWTFIHEVYHAIGHEYKLQLTEKQVLGLEKGTRALYKLNKDFMILPPDE